MENQSAAAKEPAFNDDDFDDEDEDFNEMLLDLEGKSQASDELSQGQKSRMEKNKLKAIALKKARLMTNPYNHKNGEKKINSVKREEVN